MNHPATVMWRGYIPLLGAYGVCITEEWIARGNADTTLDFFHEAFDSAAIAFPSWLGMEEFHLSHQSNLIRKLPSHYSDQFPGVPDDLPYVWPGEDAMLPTPRPPHTVSEREKITIRDYLLFD